MVEEKIHIFVLIEILGSKILEQYYTRLSQNRVEHIVVYQAGEDQPLSQHTL